MLVMTFTNGDLIVDGQVLLKIFSAIAAIISVWLDFRPKEKKYNVDPSIASADASERHAWRYCRWGFRIVQITIGVYLLGMVIKFILT
jgi:hypothetical protein